MRKLSSDELGVAEAAAIRVAVIYHATRRVRNRSGGCERHQTHRAWCAQQFSWWTIINVALAESPESEGVPDAPITHRGNHAARIRRAQIGLRKVHAELVLGARRGN
jgi:hypothetical protein